MQFRSMAATLALLVIGVTLAIPAFAADGDDSTLSTGVTASVASVSPNYLTSATPLSIRVALTAGPAGATGVDSVFAVTTSPLDDAAAVDAFLASPQDVPARGIGHAQPAEFLQGASQAIGSLAPGSTGFASVSIDPTTLAFPAGSSGVYGIVITTHADGVDPIRNALVMAWIDAPLPRMDVAVVATVSGSAERARALLTAASDERVALLVDTTALIGIAGASDAIAARELYGLPAGHLDVASAIHGGAVPLLGFALERSRLNEPAGLPWIAVPATLDSSIVDQASAHAAEAILVGPSFESTYPAASTPVVNLTSETGASVPAVLANERLSSVLASLPQDDAGAPARLVAESALYALAHADADAPLVAVIAPGDSWVVDGTQASPEITAIFAAPWVRPIALSTALAASERDTVEASSSPITARDVPADVLVTVQQTVSRLIDLAAATDQPALILDGPARDLLSSASLTTRADSESRAAGIDSALADAVEVLDKVRVTSGSELTLVSNSGNVPITLRNDLDSTVTVVVVMTSRSPNLIINSQPTAVLAPDTEATVLVPVTAVSNDDVAVTVALRNEAGATLAVAKTLEVRVRAAWGNVATAVATAALVVLLVAGLWRTIRRGQRDTRIGPSTEDPQGPIPAAATPREP